MGLLRIVILVLLFLLVVRLLTNLLAEIGRRSRRPSAPPPRHSTSVPPTQPRQLVACPVCGTYFEPRRGLPVATGGGGESIAVCSEPCRARHAETLRDGGRR